MTIDPRGGMGRADLVRLIRACPEAVTAFAALLGYVPHLDDAAEHQRERSGDDDGSAESGSTGAEHEDLDEGADEGADDAPAGSIWCVVDEEQRSLPTPEPVDTPGPLPPEGGNVLALPPTPDLVPWRALWPRLYDLIAAERPGRAPDVRALTRQLAQARPIRRIPPRQHRAWPERLTLWIDRRPELIPLWHDQDLVKAELRRWCPTLDIRLRRHQFATRPGESALLLGDLSALPTADAIAWQAEQHGARLAALTARPVKLRRWRSALWETPLATLGTPAARADRLLALAATSTWVRPGQLRALRLTLPRALADITTELDVWNHPDVAARAHDGLVLRTSAGRQLRRGLALADPEAIRAVIEVWHARLPRTLRHLDTLFFPARAAAADVAAARDYFELLLAHVRTGGLDELAGFTQQASDLLATVIGRYPEWRSLVSQLWVAGHPEPDTAVPEGIDPSKASLIRPGEATDLHLLHAEGALRLAAGRPQGIRLAGLRSTQPVAWVGQGGSRQQQRLGEPIDLAQAARVEIETDLSRVVVEKLERPAWAVAFGVRQGRVWADADLDGEPRRLWWTSGDLWEGADGYGADAFGVYHIADFSSQSMRFRLIPAGEFLMGSPESDAEAHSDERPQHSVRLTAPFWLAEVPVTQAVWQAVMGKNPAHFKGPDRPVESVNWDDAQAFIATASTPDRAWRLPTEAQWEYACRAGTTLPRYGDLDAVAWWSGNSGRETHPVGQKQPNPWGLFDLLGNVYEWCADFAYRRYETTLQVDPAGPARGSSRVIRGGAWSSSARFVRAASRNGLSPGGRLAYLGFRLSRGQAAPSPRSGQPRAEPAPPARSAGPSGQARSAGGGARPEGGAAERKRGPRP